MTKPKADALAALSKVWAVLDADTPLDGLARAVLKASVEYAITKVQAVEELKHARRVKKGSAPMTLAGGQGGTG